MVPSTHEYSETSKSSDVLSLSLKRENISYYGGIDSNLNEDHSGTDFSDNNSDETCGVLVTITPAKEGYETYYKVGSNEYSLYTEPFKIYNMKISNWKLNINVIEL